LGILESGRVKVLKNNPFSGISLSGLKLSLDKVRLLAPVKPGKIVLVGLNYRKHARELKMKIPGEPIIFLKPPTAVIGPKANIVYPKEVRRLDYEAELAVVVKKEAKNISSPNCDKYILGYTCLNDVTARDLQKRDSQWTRAKSFDTFCPIGPWLETDLNPKNLRVRSYLNGVLKQDASTSDFIFSLPYLIRFVSSVMTLLPGDVISTGTPSGVGSMLPGDRIDVDIQGIGRLSNRVYSLSRK